MAKQNFSTMRLDINQSKSEKRALLENLVLDRLQELKVMEIGLDRQFAGLRFASSRARALFLRRLLDFDQRALRLERLVDGLDIAGERSSLQLELV